MTIPDLRGVERTTITVDGFRTHYLAAGSGAPVVLLHAGDFGASAETSWHEVIGPLAKSGYRVIAPDWLGFGRSDKIVDFADPHGRRLSHMRATVEALELGTPAMIGFSMGGTLLARALARPDPLLPAGLAVLAHGGGFAPLNAARKVLQDYDLTPAGMAKMLQTALYSNRWSSDEEYVAWRHRLSLEPGAWAAVAAARVRPPGAQSGDFGTADTTAYEQISVPTLVVAGANDPLREPGYAAELSERIPDSELLVYPECGHGAPLEQAARFVEDVVSFLDRRYHPRP